MQGRADLLLGQRGAARQARRRRKGLRRAGADVNAVQALIKGGQLKPLDKAQLPNLKNINPIYLNTSFDPGNKYSVPYAMSTTILGYNDQKMKELGIPTDTWAVIFDPKYLEKIKGRVTVLDSANELFAAALKYLGYSANDADPKHWKRGAPTSSRRPSPTGRRSTRRRTSRS